MRVLVVGGAGFIGSNVALRHAERGDQVTILDNLSRSGSALNLQWVLEEQPGIRFSHADIRTDLRVMEPAVREAELVYHLAAQVAVTTSVANPRLDFEVNALGTLNVLECARRADPPPLLIYASTNKVYGDLSHLPLVEEETRYLLPTRGAGIDEREPLDLYSPYGCSKGAGDQYVRDYARIYGVPTVVFRQSCIYGERQIGTEDQGWVAWFLLAAKLGRGITVYGDGKQVRDLLHIDDLLAAYDAAVRVIRVTSGQIYNLGGGPEMTLSLLEFVRIMEDHLGLRVESRYSDWRPGDQRVYVSDIRRAVSDLGWRPRTGIEDGLRRLSAWLSRLIERGAIPPLLGERSVTGAT